MSWKPIVVGVDGSREAAGAAALAFRIGLATDTTCHLVSAARDGWASLQVQEGVERLRQGLVDQHRARLTASLKEVVPRELLDSLIVRLGRASSVLKQTASELGAELVVLGGKHHAALDRWLGGSTSLNVARTTDVPMLVTAGSPAKIRRVLVAVDLSWAARPTLLAAKRYADKLGAELRALSAFEPFPVIPEVTPPDTAEFHAMTAELLQRDLWPLVPGVEKVLRSGVPVEVILREAAEWKADLLVVGSHGRGWAERMIVGSVTERLLNQLPTSLLVIPVRAAAGADREAVSATAEEMSTVPIG
jgi:nucleotide-binding universal stress UspA family protein